MLIGSWRCSRLPQIDRNDDWIKAPQVLVIQPEATDSFRKRFVKNNEAVGIRNGPGAQTQG